MINYIDFLNEDFLEEKLTSDQTARVDNWKRGDYSFSDKALDYKDKIRIPLVHHDDPTVAPTQLHEHLKKHGYEISDYKNGTAKDHYGRNVKIGKVLNKTEAPDEIKKAFENDSGRAAKKSQNYDVVVSRHPHDVAGMSTGRSGWDSCMNMETGENRRYLKNDVSAGTHVAYLVHKDDKDIENPLARIALKPFIGENGHKVLRPEEQQYGTGGDSFAHTMRKWSEDNFPVQKKQMYHKDRTLYDDSGNSTFMSNDPETTDHFANNGLPDEKAHLVGSASKHIIDHIMESDKFSASQPAFKNALIKRGIPEHLDNIMANDPSENDVTHILEAHGRPKDLDAAITHTSSYIRSDVAKYGTKRHHDILMNDTSPTVRASVAEHGSDSHRDQLVNDTSDTVRRLVAKSGNRNHLSQLVHDKDSSVRQIVAAKGYGHDDLVDDKNMYVRATVAEQGELKHAKKLMEDKSPYVIASIAKNKKLPELADKLVAHPNPEVRTYIAQAGNKDHLDKLVNDPSPEVREAVAEHGHRSHIQILKNDKDANVRETAKAVAREAEHDD